MNDELFQLLSDGVDALSRIASAMEEANSLETKRMTLEHGEDEAPTTQEL